MADILLKCPDCGCENKVSEYATPGSVFCTQCNRALDVPSQEGGLRLKVRRIKTDDHTTTLSGNQKGPVGAAPGPTIPSEEVNAVLGDVHKVREKIKGPRAIWSIIGFLIIGGALVGAQYYLSEYGTALLSYYNIGRLVLGGLIWLMVIMMAFEDSILQGILCMFLPLYIVYYIFVRMDSYLLTGAFLGVCACLLAELHFMPENALLIAAQNGVNTFIDSVAGLIQRAGDAPVY